MEQVTINPYNPRTPRDNRDFINTLINDEKPHSSEVRRRNVDMVAGLSINDLPW